MGILDTIINSFMVVIAGILGFGMFIGGAQQAAFGNETVGGVTALIGIVLLVFATRL